MPKRLLLCGKTGLNVAFKAAQDGFIQTGQLPPVRWAGRQFADGLNRDTQAYNWAYQKLGQAWQFGLGRCAQDLMKVSNWLPARSTLLQSIKDEIKEWSLQACKAEQWLKNNDSGRKMIGSFTFLGVWYPSFGLLIHPYVAVGKAATVYAGLSWGRFFSKTLVSSMKAKKAVKPVKLVTQHAAKPKPVAIS